MTRMLDFRAVGTLALLTTLAAGCLQAGPGACSDWERELFNEIRQFGDVVLEAEDHAWGTCHAAFTTRADTDAVLAHYEAELRDTGWERVARDVADPPPGAESPRPGAEASIAIVGGWKGNVHYSVEVTAPGSASDQLTVSLHVGG